MRVFQFQSYYLPYLEAFDRLFPEARYTSFEARRSLLFSHRFLAAHILKPALEGAPEVFYTVANDDTLQSAWSLKHGLSGRSRQEILLAQIEEHRADVVYALDPITYGADFLKRLPGCVRRTVCWNAAPTFGRDLGQYNLRVCNFPPVLEAWRAQGIRSAWFSPSHDSAMIPHAANEKRPIDICYVGQYSPVHRNRNSLLEAVASLAGRWTISFRLLCPRWKPVAQIRGFRRIPSFVPYLPTALRRVSGPPVFGEDMYFLLGLSKIVFNAAIDMAGNWRGNMRCFEALGCGACMVSDAGEYPEPFLPGRDFATYGGAHEAVAVMEHLLSNPQERLNLAAKGRRLIETHFSKELQWTEFNRLVAEL